MTTATWLLIGLVIVVTTAAPFGLIYIARRAGTHKGKDGGSATPTSGTARKPQAEYSSKTDSGGDV